MNVIILTNPEPPMTAFAPTWAYVMAEEKVPPHVDIPAIAQFLLDKEKEILALPLPEGVPDDKADGYTGLGPNSTTARFSKYNVFKWDNPNIQNLLQELKVFYKKFLKAINVPTETVWMSAWVNILRDGQRINQHIHATHAYTYLGGHITIQANNTSTVYIHPIDQISEPRYVDKPNIPGTMTLFQNNIPHFTTEHKGEKERITIALDIIVDRQYQSMMEQGSERAKHMIKLDERV